MIDVNLSKLSEVTQGRLLGEDLVISKMATDTRDDCEGALFFALKGPSFDAHNFIDLAIENGALAVVVNQPKNFKVPQLIVKDTRLALGDIAKHIRSQSKAKVIGLTGSVGKTSVKEMISTILSQSGQTLSTKGNLNNDIGVPLTLFNLHRQHKFAVVEMGANHQGEIQYTTTIVQPDVALLTNVAPAHLEGFGDLQGVAHAKGEIFNGLDSSGIAVINEDDRFASYWRQSIKQKIMSFGMKNKADVSATEVSFNDGCCPCFKINFGDEALTIELQVPGVHNVMNSLAAAAACLAAGISLSVIARGLRQFKGVHGRLHIDEVASGIKLMDDTYNANYTSLSAAIDVLSHFEGVKIIALGDMGELGKEAREYHEKAGIKAKEAGIDYLLTVGVLSQCAHHSFGEGAFHFPSREALSEWIIKQLKETKGTVLFKGSRSAHMEQVVESVKLWCQRSLEGKLSC